MQYKTISNGVKIPVIGFGVFRAEDGEQTANAVKWALEAGYRHIDTACVYKNEEGVGRGIKESGVPREEIFITTKVSNASVRAGETEKNFNESLEKLGVDYIDLYLIHWPVDGKIEAWKTMEKLYTEGKIRAIGVSNFHQNHFDELLKEATIKPMVNQIESNPSFTNEALIEKCLADGLVVEAWSPLGGSLQTSVRTEETIIKIAEKYNKSAVQVIIRWAVQRNIVVLPKSVTKERIIQNIDVFDFELTAEEMSAITALNKNVRSGSDPDNFSF